MSTNVLRRRAPTPAAFSPFAREIDQLQANIRRMFDEPFGAATGMLASLPQSIGWTPAVEISESAGELTITAELPGMARDDVHVQLDGDVLTLRGEKQAERKEGEAGAEYYLVERSYGAFQRSFALPSDVDPDSIKATFDKGVLTIRLHKTAPAPRNGREIPIDAK